MRPQLVIRADAGARLGVGHFMRTLALAQAWQARGGCVTFIGRAGSAGLRQRVESAGIGFIPLEWEHPDPSDLPTTLRHLEELAARRSCRPWVVLDGYHLDSAYQREIRAVDYRLVVIDDIAHQPYYHADVLLNQNINAHCLPYRCDPETLLLLGTRYALLRPEFLSWRTAQREIPDVARRVLVTLGGGDPHGVTLKVIEALTTADVEELEAKVVIGPTNPHFNGLKRATQGCSFRIQLESDPATMAELMAWADVAISAGGSTSWELAFMGLPSLVMVLAENQKVVAEGLHEAGGAVNLGGHENVTVPKIADELSALCWDRDRRRKLSEKGQALVDGAGTERLLDIMGVLNDLEFDQSRLILRSATLQDMLQIWRLSNDPVVRKNSFSPKQIAWHDHVSWYRNKLESANSRIWVLELGGVIAAQVRYDRTESGYLEVGFSVGSLFRGRGLGTKILALTCNDACEKLGATSVRGFVFKDNTTSVRAFSKAGFEQVEEIEHRGHPCYVFERRSG